MPAIIVSNVEFDSGVGYYVDLHELRETFPHVEKDKEVELHLVEIRDEQAKLIRRFKPFKKLCLKTGEHYNSYYGCEKHLCLAEDIVTQFNIGKNYKVTLILLKYDNKPLLPLEIKSIGYNAQKVLEYLSKIEANLLSLTFEQSELNEAVSHLWDAYFRLEENDIEGARTSIRKALDEVIRKELIPKIKVVEEVEDFPKRLENLVKGLIELVQYGGPHRGPAPKTTTEMVITISTKLTEHLARALETKIISLKEGA